MIPGPSNVLSCPFCSGTKEVMTLISGNSFRATVWSDTRRNYPMLPEVSPIQKCPHCNKYYFIEQAKSRHDDNSHSFELGHLSYPELLEAHAQFSELTLTTMQRWVLNHQIFLAYNDRFRRNTEGADALTPSADEAEFYARIIQELLEGIDSSKDFELFHAELLRETRRFEEAKAVLLSHDSENDRWVVDAMMRHIEAGDAEPFLLIKDGAMQN